MRRILGRVLGAALATMMLEEVSRAAGPADVYGTPVAALTAQRLGAELRVVGATDTILGTLVRYDPSQVILRTAGAQPSHRIVPVAGVEELAVQRVSHQKGVAYGTIGGALLGAVVFHFTAEGLNWEFWGGDTPQEGKRNRDQRELQGAMLGGFLGFGIGHLGAFAQKTWQVVYHRQDVPGEK